MKNNEIKLAPSDICTGCSACAVSCASGALKMSVDQFGFLTPEIDVSSCTSCQNCIKSCPVINPVSFYPEASSYAAQADTALREISTSGGVFSLLAKQIINENGAVFGAALCDDMRVTHICAENEEQLALLRGSKYVQSDIGNTYAEARALLEKGKKVLFSGCPCQIAGLRSYLKKEYDNLYTVDVLCHGVPSSLFFKEYLDENFGGVKSVSFRDKTHGQGWKCDSLYVISQEGEDYSLSISSSSYEKCFHSSIILRQSCYSCRYNSPERVGDITLGDFWGIEQYKPELNDNMGTSFVQPNTPQGRYLMEKIRPDLKMIEEAPKSISKENKYNCLPRQETSERKRFFDLYPKYGFKKASEYAGYKKYDIGIVGCWSIENHGSNMCYYGLYQAICDMGFEPLMIERPDNAPWKPNSTPSGFAESPYSPWALAPIYPNKSAMNQINEQCDTFVLGSDQLFYHDLYSSLGEVADLSFIDSSKRMIAYGASVGRPQFEGSVEQIAKLSYYLSRFDAISVRERDGIALFNDTFGIKADSVLDPVFLCDKKNYISMAERGTKIKDKSYIASYILDPNLKKEQILLSVADTMNKPLHIFSDVVYSEDNISDVWSLKMSTLTTNEDWLRAIIDSDFVITDSFHGMCFAIIFNKPFLCIANRRRGVSRFSSLLGTLGLEHRMVFNLTDDIVDICLEAIDYKTVSEILKAETERSLEWLKKALKCPRKKSMSGYDLLNKRLSYDELVQEETYNRGISSEKWLFNTHERVDLLEQQLQQETDRAVSAEKWLSNTRERVDLLEQQLQQETDRAVSTEKWLFNTHERVDLLEQQLQQETDRDSSTDELVSLIHERVNMLEEQQHKSEQSLTEAEQKLYKQGKTISELKYRIEELEKQTLWTLLKNTIKQLFSKK